MLQIQASRIHETCISVPTFIGIMVFKLIRVSPQPQFRIANYLLHISDHKMSILYNGGVLTIMDCAMNYVTYEIST